MLPVHVPEASSARTACGAASVTAASASALQRIRACMGAGLASVAATATADCAAAPRSAFARVLHVCFELLGELLRLVLHAGPSHVLAFVRLDVTTTCCAGAHQQRAQNHRSM